jgi:methionine synthase II (cobalamin-independent)
MPVLPALGALSIGSLPYTDVHHACRRILQHFPEIPAWPQLPRRSFQENMYAQFSERFPGIVLATDRLWVDRQEDLSPALEALYAAYLEDDLCYGEISPPYAAALRPFLDLIRAGLPDGASAPVRAGARPCPTSDAPHTMPTNHRLASPRDTQCALEAPPLYLKAQVTGPVSWGLTVLDGDRRPTLYDEILADAIARHLRLKARWLERTLRQTCSHTLISVDEPYLSSFGSAYVSLGREQAAALIEEVLSGIDGLTMVHCCGNTDWSLLLETSVDILSFDAYSYAAHVSLYPEEIAAFLDRGGMLAWGITPKTDDAYSETVEGLVDRLCGAMRTLAGKGIHIDDILRASLISPSCGLGPLSEPLAEHVLELTAGVSSAMRERYA